MMPAISTIKIKYFIRDAHCGSHGQQRAIPMSKKLLGG